MLAHRRPNALPKGAGCGGAPPSTPPFGLIFDMDGVVVDNMGHHVRAWGAFFKSRGIKLKRAEFYEETSGMPTRDVLSFYFKRRVSKAEADRLGPQKEELYRRIYGPRMKPARGLVPFLKASRKAGFRLGLGTGSDRENIDFILDGLKIRRFFHAVVGARDVKRGKPHPETFLKAARRMGVRPEHCLVLEDSLLGEKSAKRAGMKVIAVTTAHKVAEFSSPALSIRDFSRITPGLVRELLSQRRGT